MSRYIRIGRDETVEQEDRSRPNESTYHRMMLNNCQRCGRYKYVLCLSDGPFAYLCGRCSRELKAKPMETR